MSWEKLYWRSHKYNSRKKLKTGTYLHTFCPHCLKEMTEGEKLVLEVINPLDQVGQIELSPYLNIFERSSNIQLPEGHIAKDLRCPHCHQSLMVPENTCGSCGAQVARLLIQVSDHKVPFFICMKIGCTWHALAPEDEQRIILEDSDEW